MTIATTIRMTNSCEVFEPAGVMARPFRHPRRFHSRSEVKSTRGRFWNLGLATAALAMLCACSAARSAGTGDEAASHTLAYQKNDGAAIVEYAAPCPGALGRLVAGPDGNE